MGNEESQQGVPGTQQGAPTYGMGAPPQQPRFPVGPQGGARPPGPTGGPGPPFRAPVPTGGPGPPYRAPVPTGGPGLSFRAPGPTGPPRPVQVGVQPWADPPAAPGPLQPRFRGPVPPVAAPPPPMIAESEAGLDLSNLSEVEKAKILSVMARAQDMDEDYERHKRGKEEPILCPLCRLADLAMETNKMCGDCGKNFCQKCGTFVPGEGRRSVWVCNTCSNRRKQQQQLSSTTHDNSHAGQKVAVVDPTRKDESISRMGQPFQQQQQPLQQQQMQQPQQQQPSVSLIGTSSGGFVSGSLIPTSAMSSGIPRTVPLNQPQWNGQNQLQQQMIQQGTQQSSGLQVQPQIVLQTQQQVLPQKAEWGADLSPILDVSPSLEAAEQELMEKCQEEQLRPIPRATSGTISGMLADFNKALGLANTPPETPQPTVGGTEMDQNQNLVQQQFQLQQQQLMIQQQQQVIHQQQQQLQQQAQLQQQIQQQQQLQNQQLQNQQLQQQQHAITVMQQQDMQQQILTTTQTQSQHLHTQQQLQQQQQGVVVGGTPMQQQPQTQRKVQRRLPQPTMEQMHAAVAIAAQTPKSKSQSISRSVIGVTPSFQRPISPLMAPGTNTRKDSQQESSLLDSESKKVRRRLPPVPLDQEPTTAPLRRAKDRARTLSMGAMPATWGERTMPHRTTSLDDGMSLTVTTASSDLDFLGLTSSIDSYLQFLATRELDKFLTTTAPITTTTTSILDSIPSSIGLSTSLLGRRDLSAPQSLSSYLRAGLRGSGVVPSASASYLLDNTGDSKLPSYIHSLKQQFRDELRATTDIGRRRPTDTDLWLEDRKLGSSTLPLSATGGSAALRRAKRRRHASDTKLASVLNRDTYLDDPLYRYKSYPFKSFEFESIDDHLRNDGLYGTYGRFRRRSSLTDAPSRYRDELLTSRSALDTRRYNRLRRHTDTGLVDPYGRSMSLLGRRIPRSWHPSPYGSEEEEDEREEKKAKIKAEIARRRAHIEERLHDIATSRDTGLSPAYGDRLYSSPISLESGGSSMDDDYYFQRHSRHPYANPYGVPHPPRRTHASSSFPGYESTGRYWQSYDSSLEESFCDPLYSPLDPEADLAPMPLLPDMPARSRKILHDIYTPAHQRAPRTGGVPYAEDEYVDGSGRPPALSPGERQSAAHQRKAQNSKTSQKYDFPVKRILLTRDPKDRSVSGNGLGMKVVGGKEIPGSNGMIGAYVARIYPGGVVETLGEVTEGDQVLEWNGVSLTGRTYEEVQRIIASSGDEVEIVIRSDFNMLTSRSTTQHNHHRHQQQQHDHHHPPQSHLHKTPGGSGSSYQEQQPRHHQQQGGSRSNNSYHHSTNEYRNTYNGNYDDYYQRQDEADSREVDVYEGSSSQRQQRILSPTIKGENIIYNKEKYKAENITGEIQLQVCHDSKAAVLYVTVVRARNLVTSRDNSGLPDPFVVCYLRPENVARDSERRTRYFSRCSDPEWKQTMVYPNLSLEQLKRRHLEISVWNYDINGPPEFLGEVLLELRDSSIIDEQSRWHKLSPHDPKKYPQSGGPDASIKMARLNNPHKTLYFDDDVRKCNNLDKKFFIKQLNKKSNVNESYTRVSSQSFRLPALHSGNINTHPLLPQGCHVHPICCIL